MDWWHTYLEFELSIAEEGGLAQYFKTLVIVFDTRLLIAYIQIRLGLGLGLDESGKPLNVSNDPF